MAFLTLTRSMGQTKVISAMWWPLIIQSNGGGGVRGYSWERMCVPSCPFCGFGKVSDGPKPLVHCSDIPSVFLVHVVGVIMPASLGYGTH